jgi:hypothetical protein
MAHPRIFVSSTYYDLKHIRSSLELFIESLGYDSILSEKGDIAYLHNAPLDESCYREAANSDMLVLIIGGRYGSESSSNNTSNKVDFFSRYESITKKEYESANERDVPIYILIDDNVYSEYQTFTRNRDGKINYAHVDSANIFRFIDQIIGMKRNNPIKTFGRFADIELWLKEQWSGLFRELLNKRSQQQQLKEITAQISDLREINETLRRYMENIMTNKNIEESKILITAEETRLGALRRHEEIMNNPFGKYVVRIGKVTIENFDNILSGSSNAKEFEDLLLGKLGSDGVDILSLIEKNDGVKRDINNLRKKIGKKDIYEVKDFDFETKKEQFLRSKTHRGKAV